MLEGNAEGCSDLPPDVSKNSVGINGAAQLQNSENDKSDALLSEEETNASMSVCQQRLQMWTVYQRTAAEQFAALSELYRRLETSCGTPPTDGPRTAGTRARLAVSCTTCQQLYASSQEQSENLAAEVSCQMEELASRLHLARHTFVTVGRLVEPDAAESVLLSPAVLVRSVQRALLELRERARSLETELSAVSARLERSEQQLRTATTGPHPADTRLKALAEDRNRQVALLQARADSARSQSQELQKQLDALRERATAAVESSSAKQQELQTQLFETHTKLRDSQRQLYQVKSQLTREVGSLRSEKDILAIKLSRFQRAENIDRNSAALEREAAFKALQVLNTDRRRLLTQLCESGTKLSQALTHLEQAKQDHTLKDQLEEKRDLIDDLRTRLEVTNQRLTEMEAEHRDASAALREELALRTAQIADLHQLLLTAKRTIVEQEVQNDYLQQRLEEAGGSPTASDASQALTARLSPRTEGGRRADAHAEEEAEEVARLRQLVTSGAAEVRRLRAQLDEASRTTEMLRTELRVALEALQNQRREADFRLSQVSASDTRILDVGRVEQRNRELRALATRWQLRAEASERSARQTSHALEDERTKRKEMESSLMEASGKMREIQQQLEQQDQYSTWAKLNQSLQLKQVESVMLALLKVAPRTAKSESASDKAAPPSAGGDEVAPPSPPYDPPEPRSILKPSGGGEQSCSAGSLTSTEPDTSETERFDSLAAQPCDSSLSQEPLTRH